MPSRSVGMPSNTRTDLSTHCVSTHKEKHARASEGMAPRHQAGVKQSVPFRHRESTAIAGHQDDGESNVPMGRLPSVTQVKYG